MLVLDFKCLIITQHVSNFYCLCFAIFVGSFGNLTYSLTGDQSKNFYIDTLNGAITVQNSSFLDRERLGESSFSVMAIDKAPITTRRSAVVPVTIYSIAYYRP